MSGEREQLERGRREAAREWWWQSVLTPPLSIGSWWSACVAAENGHILGMWLCVALAVAGPIFTVAYGAGSIVLNGQCREEGLDH